MKKSDLGQFNTKRDVWLKPQVKEFITTSPSTNGLDPFAGAGDLVKVMFDLGLKKVKGLDIDSKLNWTVNDSLVSIPYYRDTIVITNPPYYARVSASRNKSSCSNYFDGNTFADLYQIAIVKVMAVYDEAVFIIPETYFLTDDMYHKEDLSSITVLEDNPFYDTDCPVCVACFLKGSPLGYPSYDIYKNDKFLFDNIELDKIKDKYKTETNAQMSFNAPKGNIGLRGVDSTNPKDKIRFCLPEELGYDHKKVKESSRSITIIDVKSDFDREKVIERANNYLNQLRDLTQDVIFAPFKGNNKAGERRRRLDYEWARKILNKALTNAN